MPEDNILNTSGQIRQTESILDNSSKKYDLMSKYFATRDENVFKLFEIVQKIVSTKIPLFITGESGVGKENFAKAVHIAGGQLKGRFIAANCSNLPSNFFEMDLFGISKTYFSDTQSLTPQYFDVCTLMLDEVTNLDKHLQFHLLRVLSEQEKNSNTRTYTGTAIDARIIACTKKNIQNEINAGRFSEELFSKLNIISIEIPPLRMRLQDIDLYIEMFLAEFNAQYSKKISLTCSAKQALRQYSWPGNTRELRNVLQRAVLLHSNDISCEDLHWVNINKPTEIAMSTPLPQTTVAELEQYLILQTLRRHNGNRTHTAKSLGISLRALRYKLKELIECGYEIESKATL